MRYRLRTLLIVMFAAALVCLALRAPSIWWSSGIVGVFLLAWLTSVLIAIYRSGQLRAMAVGFCIFSSGFLGVQGSLWTISSGSFSLSRPTHELIRLSFDELHRHRKTDSVTNDPFRSRTMVSDDPFAPDPLARQFESYRTICMTALAFLVGLTGAIVAQILEKTRKPRC